MENTTRFEQSEILEHKDVNNIAASLQALLGIPPINQSYTPDNITPDAKHITNAFPPLSFSSALQNSSSNLNTAPAPQQPQQFNSNSYARPQDIGSISADKRSLPTHLNPHNAQTKYQHHAPVELPNLFNNGHSSHLSEQIFGYNVRNDNQQRPSGDISGNVGQPPRRSRYEPRPTDNRPKQRSGTPIKQLLASPDCPNDLQKSAQLLIESSFNEHKPTNFLHEDEPLVKLFRTHSIGPLKKKSTKFPRAKYLCDLCNYHMDSVYNVINHIINTRHRQNARKLELNQVLNCVGAPSQAHQAAMSQHILNIVEAYGISNQEISNRKRIVDHLNQLIATTGLPCHLSLFGSSASGFGFKNSDVNINVTMDLKNDTHPDSTEQSQILNQLYQTLRDSPDCKDVTELFSAKLMSVKFINAATGNHCVVHANNTSGVSLSRLFAEYDKCDPRVRPLVIMFRYFAKLAQIDNQNEGTLPSHCYSILALHYLQTCGVIPNLHTVSGKIVDEAVNVLDDFASAEEASTVWKTDNQQNIGYLWLDMLNYYSVRFMNKEEVVSVTHAELKRKTDNIWNRKLSIQDPILKRSNLSRSLCSNKICDYIIDRICTAFRYFAIPRTKLGPLYDGILFEKAAAYRGLRVFHFGKPNELPSTSTPMARFVCGTNHLGRDSLLAIFEDLHLVHGKLQIDEYAYDLDQNTAQDGEKPPKICKSCGNEGHLKKDCPDEAVPIIRPVKTPSRFTIQILSQVMMTNYDREALNDQDVDVRQKITNEISSALKPVFPDIDLTMFGSTYNGFGLHLSDVDICLRFKDNPINKATITQEEVTKILTTVVDRLKAMGCFQNILPIPSAKVPIVKFTHQRSGLEGDISLSNILALHNTKMLATYCAIDNRLKVLGCFLKKVTKFCDISDASKGSLSSYGFVLMLIHFLQQHNPPVLPVLQELPPQSTVLVDGSNAWFYDDLQTLKNVWTEMGRNQESVAELWLAFLVYYTEVFNFEEHIIQIHQKGCVTRFSKLWLTDTLIAVQDPFDHAHNLGAGLSRRMGVYIVKCFQRFRDSFHLSVDHVRSNDWMDFFLNPRRIRGNFNPPIDRQCRICNRIGHFAKNCTQNLAAGNGGSESEDKLDVDLEERVRAEDENNPDSRNAKEEEFPTPVSGGRDYRDDLPTSKQLDKADNSTFQLLQPNSEQTKPVSNPNGKVGMGGDSLDLDSPYNIYLHSALLQNKTMEIDPNYSRTNDERFRGLLLNKPPLDGEYGREAEELQRIITEELEKNAPRPPRTNKTVSDLELAAELRNPSSEINTRPFQPYRRALDDINAPCPFPSIDNVPPPGFLPRGFPANPTPSYPSYAANLRQNQSPHAQHIPSPSHEANDSLEYERCLKRIMDEQVMAMMNPNDALDVEFPNRVKFVVERSKELARQEMANRAFFNSVPHSPSDVQTIPHPQYNLANQHPPVVLMSQVQGQQRAGENPAVNPYLVSHVNQSHPGIHQYHSQGMQPPNNGHPNFMPAFQPQMGYTHPPPQFVNHYQQPQGDESSWSNVRNTLQNHDQHNNEP